MDGRTEEEEEIVLMVTGRDGGGGVKCGHIKRLIEIKCWNIGHVATRFVQLRLLTFSRIARQNASLLRVTCPCICSSWLECHQCQKRFMYRSNLRYHIKISWKQMIFWLLYLSKRDSLYMCVLRLPKVLWKLMILWMSPLSAKVYLY